MEKIFGLEESTVERICKFCEVKADINAPYTNNFWGTLLRGSEMLPESEKKQLRDIVGDGSGI